MIVVKYGGHAMGADSSFASDVAKLVAQGEKVVVVHGGGPQISAMLDRVGLVTEFHNGLRVTTPEVMQIARMVLLSVGKDLVASLAAQGLKAVAVSGEDGGLIAARRSPQNIGLVGEVQSIDPALLHTLLAAGYVPVVSTLAPDAEGVAHNLNADIAAGGLAVALSADKLVMITDVPGLYRHWPDPASLIAKITAPELEELLPGLEKGMVPKMQACLSAVRGGVAAAAVGVSLTQHGTVVLP
jgi:acetylglutamate kinase